MLCLTVVLAGDVMTLANHKPWPRDVTPWASIRSELGPKTCPWLTVSHHALLWRHSPTWVDLVLG